jgi:ketosteroid isomerase-like protein
MSATAIEDYVIFFETLTSQTPKESYATFFDEESFFEDPFGRVQGVDAIFRIFEHMYESLHLARFVVDEVVGEGEVIYIKWQFIYQRSEGEKISQFVGISRLLWSEEGKIMEHRDFWDPALHIYEKIPLLGGVLRWIKGKLRA